MPIKMNKPPPVPTDGQRERDTVLQQSAARIQEARTKLSAYAQQLATRPPPQPDVHIPANPQLQPARRPNAGHVAVPVFIRGAITLPNTPHSKQRARELMNYLITEMRLTSWFAIEGIEVGEPRR